MEKPASLRLPGTDRLRRLVQFSVDDGCIWLKGDRMLLLHAAALGTLRTELIRKTGLETTRRLFMRTGYVAGERDALLARQLQENSSLFEAFAAGPLLHMLEGAVQVTPLRFEVDERSECFEAEFRWDNSWEAEFHKREFGIQPDPVCWMLIGYASGYTSGFMGRTILYEETRCVGSGHHYCHIVGKPREKWENGDETAGLYFEESSITVRPKAFGSPKIDPSPDRSGLISSQLIGCSEAFRRAFALLQSAALVNVNILLIGETGVGKERFVGALRLLGDRADKPFVAVNCAAIPHDLIESELFGAEKGAYTGAQGHAGRFERADGGILFLDEIGDLPLSAQAKLLRVIQEGEVERLGGTRTRKVDVRLVAATNRNLEEAVREGKFRADLFYRLNVYPIVIPPLRDRRDDINLLTQSILERSARKHGKPKPALTDQAIEALQNHEWPGNVRELENVLERAVILAAPGCPIDGDDLFPGIVRRPGSFLTADGKLSEKKAHPTNCQNLVRELAQLGVSLDDLEEGLLEAAVGEAGGNLSAAARLLGITRPQLSYRLRRKGASRETEEQRASSPDWN
jgi:DNA-binding NtrC family response regulator